MTNFRAFCNVTTLHGFKDYIDGNKFGKTVWAIIVIVSFWVTCYGVWQVIQSFAESPTVTQVEYKTMDMYKVPRVVVCPQRWVNETIVKHLIESKRLSENALMYAASLLHPVFINESTMNEGKQELLTFLNGNYDTLIDFYKSLMLDHNSIVGITYTNITDMNITKQYIGRDSFCYVVTFNDIPAALFSLVPFTVVIVSTKRDPNQTLIDKNYSELFTASDEATTISITADDKVSYTLQTLDLKPNIIYRLAVHASYSVKLPSRSAPCLSETTLQKPYSQSMCKGDCISTKMFNNNITNCHSLPVSLKAQEGKPCEQQDLCSFNISNTVSTFSYLTVPGKEFMQIYGPQCEAACPPLCKNWMFTLTVITENEPNKPAQYRLFYYPTNGIFYTKEVLLYTWDMFIGNIGGQIGLWMGGSILSAIQVVYFVILCCQEKISRGNLNANTSIVQALNQNGKH